MLKLRWPALNEWSYLLLFAFLVITVLLLNRQKNLHESYTEFMREAFQDHIEAEAVKVEEEVLALETVAIHPTEDLIQQVRLTDKASGPVVSFAIFFDISDCSNCLDMEVEFFNNLHHSRPPSVRAVQGYFVAEQQELIQQFMSLYNVKFPVLTENPLAEVLDSEKQMTPLVLVLDAESNTILDVHHPIPDDFQKSTLFYTKWSHILHLTTEAI